MPRIKELKKDYIGKTIRKWMIDGDVTSKELAYELNLSLAGLYYRLQHNSVDYEMLRTIIKVCDVPDEEVLKAMR